MWKGLAVAALILMIVAGVLWQRQGPVTLVTTVVVERGSVEASLHLTGVVKNDQTVTLTALLDGEIMAIKAREGDVVDAGRVLAELDPRQAQALLDKARAELIFQQQTLDAATRNYARIERLSGAGSASRQVLDDALDTRLNAQASLQIAEATLTLNQLRLDNASIRSPFAGTVIEQNAETGQWLEAGQPLFKLVATEGTVIEASVSASDWARLSLGQMVELSVPSDAQQSWSSSVNWIAPTVVDDQSLGNIVAVRFAPGDNAPALLLGQEVDVDLVLEQVDDVLVLPLSVLVESSAGEYSVFVLENDSAVQRPIELGLTSLDDAQVTQGLDEGERVIVPVGQVLHDGQAVQVR